MFKNLKLLRTNTKKLPQFNGSLYYFSTKIKEFLNKTNNNTTTTSNNTNNSSSSSKLDPNLESTANNNTNNNLNIIPNSLENHGFDQTLSTSSSNDKSLQEYIDQELKFPYKLHGCTAKTPSKIGYMGERVFAQHRIPKEFVTNHLSKIYTGSLYSIANRDEEFIHEYFEKYFADATLNSIDNLREKGYHISIINDIAGRKGEPIPAETNILDMVMVRGLSMNRDDNKDDSDYHKWVDIEDMGLVICTDKDLTNPEKFVDPEQNKRIYDNSNQVIMRVLCSIKSPLRLVIFQPDGSEIKISDMEYSWTHVAIFETQMKPPPAFKSFHKLENYMEWLGKFKFGVWKMVDLDNFMLGNPLIIKGVTSRDKYKDEIFKGSKYDPLATIDLKRV